MRTSLLLVLLFLITIVIDVAWFALFANPYYVTALGHMLRQTETGFSPDILSAIAVYLLLVLGIILFVLPKAGKRYQKAAMWGGIYGLTIYGIYDFTNYSTLTGWPGYICFLDIAWGIVLCGVISVIGVALQKKLKA